MLAAAPTLLARRQDCRTFVLIADNDFGHCGVAQPNLCSDLRPRPASFACSDDLPPSFVLFGWTELSGIVFFHASIVTEIPFNLFAGRINRMG